LLTTVHRGLLSVPDHFQLIYALHADRYEALVAREDYQGNLLPALAAICPLEGARVVEMGAGTGRMTRLLAPAARSILAMDASPHMLAQAAALIRRDGSSNVSLAVADNRRLPVGDGVADVSLQGWSFGHFTDWFPDTWQAEIGQAVDEMLRVLRPGGMAILLETLGTGSETPAPPTPGLADYYAYLERERGFSATWLRTDYRFVSLAEAESLVRFFFGDELADRVVREEWVILPECTGLWWRGR
jgi:ubiquinone/menaquinone biosynthesis C-methylase UbiE